MLYYVITALAAVAVTAGVAILIGLRRRRLSSNDNGDKAAFLENALEEERAARTES